MMRRALELAQNALYFSNPNPRVGCVLVRDGKVLGEGYTQAVGGDHAEVQAIKDACHRGHMLKNATAYVTLEPCSHIGRTLPCIHALIEAGVNRIVAAMEDPNPLVAGSGLRALRGAGMEVQCGLFAEDAYELNLGFVYRMRHGHPWVRVKVAASLDGKTALENGESQWITDQIARNDNHHWRARACAILSGIGTVMADNPHLDVRAVETVRQPLKIIVDSHLNIAEEACLLRHGLTLIASADIPAHRLDKKIRMQDHGVKIIELPNSQGKVDLQALMRYLAEHEINELHVEAGACLNGALLEAGCVHELLMYLAPSLIGQGRDMFQIQPLISLTQRHDLFFKDITQIGQSLRLLLGFASIRDAASMGPHQLRQVE